MIRIHHSILLLGVSVVAASLLLGCMGTERTVSGQAVFEHNCQGCHGAKGQGVKGSVPSLAKLGIRIPDDTIRRFIRDGRGKMPAFKELSEPELNAVVAYAKTL